MYLDLCQTCILFYLIAEGSNIWGRDRGEEEGQRNCLNFLRVVCFSVNFVNTFQNSFFIEYLWVATTNIVKYLKTLTIIIGFLRVFWIFVCIWTIWKSYLAYSIVWESCFPEKSIYTWVKRHLADSSRCMTHTIVNTPLFWLTFSAVSYKIGFSTLNLSSSFFALTTKEIS